MGRIKIIKEDQDTIHIKSLFEMVGFSYIGFVVNDPNDGTFKEMLIDSNSDKGCALISGKNNKLYERNEILSKNEILSSYSKDENIELHAFRTSEELLRWFSE